FNEVANIEGVKAVSRVVEEKVVFVYGDKQLVGNIKAVDENYTNIVHIKNYLISGDWIRPGTNEVVLGRSEEHTSELQSRENLVCRLLLEKKKNRENALYQLAKATLQ